MGLRLIETNSFKSIKDDNHELGSLYSYSIFENKYSKLFSSPFLIMCNDLFFNILGYLPVVDIFSVGQTHRLFTDKCLTHMKMDKMVWGRLYREICENECEKITYWT